MTNDGASALRVEETEVGCVTLVNHRISSHEVIEVYESDLNDLATAGTEAGDTLSFFTASIGALISACATYLTIGKPPDGWKGSLFFSIILVSALASLYFGLRWKRSKARAHTVLQRIKKRATMTEKAPVTPLKRP